MNLANTPAKASILIVDDTLENLQLLTGMLQAQGFEARPVRSGRLALQAVETDPPALILLDVNMPVLNGYEVCERLKAEPATADIPVIFLSAMHEVVDKVRAFSVGGCDYITKPFEFAEVSSRIKSHLALRDGQQKLAQSLIQLRELERFRDDLVHMIVHDMRSPLNVLSLNAAMLREELTGKVHVDALRDLDDIEAAAVQLSTMADTVLDVSRLEAQRMPLDRAQCDVGSLARSVVERFRALAGLRPLRISTSGENRALCDARLIGRVLENLLSNALKHTAPSCLVEVSVTSAPDVVHVSVRDEGEGIPVEVRAQLFEKYAGHAGRSVPRFHSSGLGLWLCKLAVEAHGGSIGVESASGEGTTFWFRLPAGLSA